MAYIPPNTNGQATMANSSPVVIASDQSTLNVTASNLPSLVTEVPAPNASSSVTRVLGEDNVIAGFSSVGSSVLDAAFVQTPIVGTGVTYNQGSGSLNIVVGTTTNAEFLARSVATFKGSVKLKYGIIASQRIANNNLMIALADLVGEGLAYNIVSATLVDVTLTAHGFTSANVGQFMNIAGITGAAGIPLRYAIQSIPNANTIRFTVAGWPATGTGTCTLFGWNQIRNLYNGTTATAVAFDSQRNGWAAGDTTATINTTASPGTIVSNESTGKDVFLMDALRATSTTPTFATRASRYENMPDPNTTLYVFIWSYNGTTAPASSTTFTLSSLSVEEFANLPVYVQGVRSNGAQNSLPVTINSGTVTTVSTVTSVTLGNLGLPSLIADVASAAIITTTTTASLTPTFGCSYEVSIPVTLVSGTTPTLDVNIEESDDSGTNFFLVYSFPRITAAGIYRSPKLVLRGNRVRYVQTVSGTSPSFTRGINRLQSSDSPNRSISQLIDRSIVLTTLNSTTASINAQNCSSVQLQINIGTTTVAPVLQLEGSDDGGSTWYSIGTALTAVASSTVSLTTANVNAQLLRARASTAGTSTIAGYVLIKAF